MTDDELLSLLEQQRGLMVAVATGGPKIQSVNEQYVQRRDEIVEELRARGLSDPNPHGDLWAWYGRWSSGDLGSWASRRTHLSEMYQPLIDQIKARQSSTGATLFEEPTGWPRVDRGIYELRRRLEQADSEEQFQAVGLLCRETLISVAQIVYDPQRHPTEHHVTPSETDAKRMLDSYIAVELAGHPNEGVRRHAKAALSLANDLQHHWIFDQVDRGIDVLVTNPELVKTGLDLLEFPTIVFMQTGYNVYTLQQASRRSWRIGQKQPVDVYFLGYGDTAQMTCLSLMAKKIAVSQSTSGDMPETGLDILNQDGDSIEVALAKKLVA